MTASLPLSGGNQNSFDPIKFYELSKIMAINTSEDYLRTAVGRAYYSMFLLASSRPSVVSLLPHTPADAGSHDIVFNTIKHDLKKILVANMLWELKKLRKEADYNMCPSEPYFQDWIKNWQRAQKLVEWLLPELQSL